MSERTGGVPLFVEEVTRLLLERGEAGGLQGIPPTLQQSLAARLDRLGEAREDRADRRCAGARFRHALLRAVAGIDDPALQSALERLADADLPYRRGRRAAGELSLQARADPGRRLREPAQEPPSGAAPPRRRSPARSTERAAAEPEVDRPSFHQAGLDDLAIEWWGKAGDQALRRSAFQEAISHLGKAIVMADKTGSTALRATGGSAAPSRRLTQLNIAYGNALIAARGYGAPETTEAFARAREFDSWRKGRSPTIGGRLRLMGR